MYITHHTNFFCKWKQTSKHIGIIDSFLDLLFRFIFEVAWLSLFSVIHWLLCAWFTFTFQLYPRSLHIFIHFSIEFTFPLLLNSLSLFSLIYFAEKDAAHKWTFMDSFWWALQFLVRKHKYNFNWKYPDHEINGFFFIKTLAEAQGKEIDLWFSSPGGAWWFWQRWVTERRFRIPGPARWFILWVQGRFHVPSSAYLLDTMSKRDLLLWGWLGYLDHWIFRCFGYYLAIFHFCQREQSLASEWLWCWASFHID